MLLRDHGTWELGDVLSYAIGYARDGHAAPAQAARDDRRVARLFTDDWRRPPRCGCRTAVLRPAPIVRNPAYAAVLDVPRRTRRARVRDDGPVGRAARIDAARREWKTGSSPRASRIPRTPHRHSTAAPRGRDRCRRLRRFDAATSRRDAEFRGARSRRRARGRRAPRSCRRCGCWSACRRPARPVDRAGRTRILEAQKLALADRDACFGDDDVDLDALLSDEYSRAPRARSRRGVARVAPGRLAGREPFRPPLRTTADRRRRGEPTRLGHPGREHAPWPPPRRHLPHRQSSDRWGNMIAVTPSGGWLQSSPAIPELGFCLGTRLQMMWLDAAAPAALRPGARPRTTLSPTLVLRDGRAVAALGTPGGGSAGAVAGSGAACACSPADTRRSRPSMHHRCTPPLLWTRFWPRGWTPAGVVVEDRLGDDVIAGLERRGHTVTRVGRLVARPGLARRAGSPRPGTAVGRRESARRCRATRAGR
jgi:gamma-glutamyltranspeptidase/glutathione hydrolase